MLQHLNSIMAQQQSLQAFVCAHIAQAMSTHPAPTQTLGNPGQMRLEANERMDKVYENEVPSSGTSADMGLLGERSDDASIETRKPQENRHSENSCYTWSLDVTSLGSFKIRYLSSPAVEAARSEEFADEDSSFDIKISVRPSMRMVKRIISWCSPSLSIYRLSAHLGAIHEVSQPKSVHNRYKCHPDYATSSWYMRDYFIRRHKIDCEDLIATDKAFRIGRYPVRTKYLPMDLPHSHQSRDISFQSWNLKCLQSLQNCHDARVLPLWLHMSLWDLVRIYRNTEYWENEKVLKTPGAWQYGECPWCQIELALYVSDYESFDILTARIHNTALMYTLSASTKETM